MTRLLRPALAALLVAAAGCTFERRPAADEAGARADTTPLFAPADTAAAEGVPDASLMEEARAFFRSFQEAREAGRMGEVRSRLHPRAALVHDGRRLSSDAPDSTLEALLAPEGVGHVTAPGTDAVEVEAVTSGVLFVARYPPAGSRRGPAVESVLLARDSAGFSVRLLHRSARGEGERP